MANVYFGDTIGQTDDNWNTSIQFTVSLVTVAPTAGAIYSNNGIQFKVTSTSIASGSGTINAGGTGTSLASGVLTKVSGTGDATIAFSAKADVNWFSNPGSTGGGGCCCSGFNIPGTPLGRLPTLADDAIVVRTVNIGPDITPWSTITRSYFVDTVGGRVPGQINAGTFSGTMALTIGSIGGSIVCTGLLQNEFESATVNGGTFSGGVLVIALGQFTINGGVFNSTVTVNTGATLNVSGGTFNVSITNAAGSSTSMSSTFTVTGSPVFNCAIPNNFSTYSLSGGVYDRDLTLGLTSPTSGSRVLVTFGAGFSSSRNLTINLKRTNGASFSTLNITGGVFTGLLTVNRISGSVINVTGGSYAPPAVTTPAIKSGNNMTFLSSAIPIDWGFAKAGGTFNPTILLSGTSNDILGSGLP